MVSSKSDRPRRVLVLGAPRSGTTWSSQVLGSAPEVRLVHEPDNEVNDAFALVAKVGLGRFPELEDASDPDARRYVELWREAFEHGEAPGGVVTKLGEVFMRRAPRSLRDHVLDGSDDLVPRLAYRAVGLVARPRTGGEPTDTIIVKSVHAAFATGLIDEAASPDHVVVVRRHPLNVLSSWTEFGWQPQGLERSETKLRLAGLDDVDPYPCASDAQQRAVSYAVLHRRFERLLAEHPTWTVVDHDEVCLDPLHAFRSLFDDLGLTWSESTERFIHDSDRPGTGYDTNRRASEERDRWKQRLDADVVAELAAVLDHYGVAVGRT